MSEEVNIKHSEQLVEENSPTTKNSQNKDDNSKKQVEVSDHHSVNNDKDNTGNHHPGNKIIIQCIEYPDIEKNEKNQKTMDLLTPKNLFKKIQSMMILKLMNLLTSMKKLMQTKLQLLINLLKKTQKNLQRIIQQMTVQILIILLKNK